MVFSPRRFSAPFRLMGFSASPTLRRPPRFSRRFLPPIAPAPFMVFLARAVRSGFPGKSAGFRPPSPMVFLGWPERSGGHPLYWGSGPRVFDGVFGLRAFRHLWDFGSRSAADFLAESDPGSAGSFMVFPASSGSSGMPRILPTFRPMSPAVPGDSAGFLRTCRRLPTAHLENLKSCRDLRG